MATLRGKALVAQSGGPTTVINSSLCGVIQECMRSQEIEAVYGGHNGILGVLTEDIFDITKETKLTIDGLKRAPSAAAGSCRYKLKSLKESQREYQRIVDVFKAHNVRYFFYIGGNDSMDTADKVATARGREQLRAARDGRAQDDRQRPGRDGPLARLRQRGQVPGHDGDGIRPGHRGAVHVRHGDGGRGDGTQRRVDRGGGGGSRTGARRTRRTWCTCRRYRSHFTNS